MAQEQEPSSVSSLRRWGIVAGLVAIVMFLLVFDLVPQLRGYKPWPPEWQWLHARGTNPMAFLPMLLAAFLMAMAGWRFDQLRRSPKKAGWLVLLLACSVLLQLSAISVRGPDLGRTVAVRTTLHWFEDFFHAAQAIDSPADAFIRYDYLRTHHNLLRVATHPPGLIWAYRIFLELGERGTPEDWGRALRPLFLFEPSASSLSDGATFALFMATLLKLLGLPLTLVGVWLIVSAFRKPGEPSVAGRAMALVALIPAAVLFSVTLDQLVMALSTLTAGLMYQAHTRRLWWPWAVAAGFAAFLQSMLAYQVVTTLFVLGVASLLYTLSLPQSPRAKLEFLARRWYALIGVLVLLWAILLLATGYNFVEELIRGIAAHNKGPIHTSRSRLAWLLWNPWDVFFFLGLAWIPFWLRCRTWAPLFSNPLLWALIAMWLVIVLTDGIRGETARIVLFSYPLLAAALVLRNRHMLDEEQYPILVALLVFQTAVFAQVLNLM